MGLVRQGMKNSELSSGRKPYSDDKTFANAANIKMKQLEKELKQLRYFAEMIPSGILDSWRRAYNLREDVKKWKDWAEKLAKRLEDSDNKADYHSFETEDILKAFNEFKTTQI